MPNRLPEITNQIHRHDILKVLEKNYSELMPFWMPMQTQWVNFIFRTFNDHIKFMIIVHLLLKTFSFYSKNFIKLNYEEFFKQKKIEIESINIMEISKSLNIAKETARRKINELEKSGVIKRFKKKIIIDREIWPAIEPEETMKRMSHFLSIFSKILYEDSLISTKINSDEIVKISKENFSLIWKLYFEMQMPMLLEYKKVYGDLETFHVHGVCLCNHALDSKKIDNSKMSKEFYLDKYFFSDKKNYKGINAMSISEITGIPRATVIRKLNKLIKEDFLTIDDKKLYSVTGARSHELIPIQKNTFKRFSIFSESIYNLSLIENN
jgi:predicted transcriptional regulator